MSALSLSELMQRIDQLNEVGKALSSERNFDRLMEKILFGARELVHADGGTLYTMTPSGKLKFEVMFNDTLEFFMGGTSGKTIPFQPLDLRDDFDTPNYSMVATSVAINQQSVMIDDVYHIDGFDFSGTRDFDKKTGYRTASMITVPMINHHDETIGVLQLLNAKHPETGVIKPFLDEEKRLIESLASQAAVALENKQLLEGVRSLFDGLLKMIAQAIDDRSPYTARHCRRVPVLALMIAEGVNSMDQGPYAGQVFDDHDLYEIEVAAWLHDCGKLTTPDYIMDKATKLEAVIDRIQLIETRFLVFKRDAEIIMLKEKLAAQKAGDEVRIRRAEDEYDKTCLAIDKAIKLIRDSNLGCEKFSKEQQDAIQKIADDYHINDLNGNDISVISDNELYNLKIERGTLNAQEREIINYHATATINMLDTLPFPKDLEHVPEYASCHHEQINGQGYPRGLTGEDMSVPARIMAIADIFEALTAKDRPYKKPKPLSEVMSILENMRDKGHIDSELYEVFVAQKIHLQYAQKFLDEEQLDMELEEKLAS